jgi:hypothetical protein
VRRCALRRVKKRKRILCRRRIVERESESRKLVFRHIGILFPLQYQSALIHPYSYTGNSPYPLLPEYPLTKNRPGFQSSARREEYPQTSSHSSSIIIIASRSLYQFLNFCDRRRVSLQHFGTRDDVLVESLVLFGGYRVSQRVAENWICS